MNEKIDINYIAKKANVSRSTVSRVLTKKTNVKESTREKVEQVMAELNYHPNSMARGLATGKQNIIALVVSDIRNPFYAQLVWTISTSLREKGYLMTLYNSADMTRKDRESLWSLLDYGFSGLIMADARKEDDFSQFLKQADCPIQQDTRHCQHIRYDHFGQYAGRISRNKASSGTWSSANRHAPRTRNFYNQSGTLRGICLCTSGSRNSIR
jgi:DNA-binding LacI/PurR family transcriptional regulator